jgi:hypothetical protein
MVIFLIQLNQVFVQKTKRLELLKQVIILDGKAGMGLKSISEVTITLTLVMKWHLLIIKNMSNKIKEVKIKISIEYSIIMKIILLVFNLLKL